MGDWLFGWFYELMYILQKSICYLLDFIRQVFSKLAGIETVGIGGENEDLLSHFLLSSQIRNAFLGVFLIGVILLFVFVIIAIIKSEAADQQHKKTKGQILVKALQSFVIFMLIPFILTAAIMLTNSIMVAINSTMSGAMIDGNSNTFLGGQILVTSGYDAFTGDAASRAEIERMFITGQLDFNSLDVVKKYYDLGKMNFFVGIGGSLIILIMFVLSAIMFVQRIFDIILLYVISPASVATIPLDDGGRFRIWREMLVSKVLGAYGIILSMNLFFLIIPQIAEVSFFNDGFKEGIVQLLFVLGGAFSITKANMVISQLTGSNAGAQEAQQMMANVSSGMRMARTAGHVAAGAAGMVIGGTDFLSNKKRGASLADNLSMTMNSKRNQRVEDKESSKGGHGGVGENGNRSNNDQSSNVKDAANSKDNPKDSNTNSASQNGENAKDNTVKTSENVSGAANAEKPNDEDNATAKEPKENNNVSEAVENVGEKSQASFGGAVKGATRLATLPAGIMKDLIQGGVVTAGKNFIPRVKNVLKGDTIINHAVKSTAKTAKNNDGGENSK